MPGGTMGWGVLGKAPGMGLMRAGGAWNRTLENNRMAAMGDSITVAGNNATYSVRNTGDTAGSYYGWSLILPKTGDSINLGKLRYHGRYATGGFTTAQILATHLPQVLAANPKPGLCCVLAGSNDMAAIKAGTTLQSTVISQLQTIYSSLLAARILPIACAVPTSTLLRPEAINLNAAIQSLASSMSLPFVDFFSVTDGGAGWMAGYSDDGIHPTTKGARPMGQLLRDTVESYLLDNYPTIINTTNEDTLSGVKWTNGTMRDDTDANNIPDGGQTQNTTVWTIASGGADVTMTLPAEGGVVSGNWWRFNKTAHTANFSMTSYGTAGIAPDLVDGHHMGYGFLCKVPTVGGVNSLIVVNGYKLTDAGVAQFSLRLSSLEWAVAPFVFYVETVVPANFAKLRLSVAMQTNTADLYFGQLTIRDLDL